MKTTNERRELFDQFPLIVRKRKKNCVTSQMYVNWL